MPRSPRDGPAGGAWRSSVGSLYHHFGGKSELFIALWQEHQVAHSVRGQAFLIAETSNSRVTLSLTRTPPVSSAAFQLMP
jgi:AcrR family transcriptional regulator